MSERSFSLTPFEASHIPAVTLTGRISLQDHLLSLHYSLKGRIEQVLLPPASRHPSRRDELWRFTCLEFFLAIKSQPGYWEFNMSPSGDWNVYRMDAYRKIGFREEIAILQLPFDFRKDTEKFMLDVAVDLTPILSPGQELQLAIAAIIQTKDNNETYWALAHPASQPDFHARESFTLQLLAAQTHPAGQSAPAG
jgi:hypothetical protein